MARKARIKVEDQDAWYHLRCRAAGGKGECPLDKPLARSKLTELMRWYTTAYCCEPASFNVMGNHYHLEVKFEKARSLSENELRRRALIMYPNSQKHLLFWTKADWEKFEKRLFNVSELMRNLNSGFARWYNKQYQRKGRFWGDRFKSTVLADRQRVQDCMLYIDLNPVRARMVERPEEWECSSVYSRVSGDDKWLTPLKELFEGAKTKNDDLRNYRARLYYRGSKPTKKNLKNNEALIPAEILEQEIAAGFVTAGEYRQRCRYFIDGLIIGDKDIIQREVDKCLENGDYKRRKNPIAQQTPGTFSLREQRSHAVSF